MRQGIERPRCATQRLIRFDAFLHELVGELLRFREVEQALVDGAPGDGADDAFLFGGAERLTSSSFEIPPLAITGTESERASSIVASMLTPVSMPSRPISVWMMASTPYSWKLLGEIEDVMAGELGPAFDRDFAFFGVERDHHVARERITGIVQEAGRLHRRGADDDVADAVIQIALDGVEVANAAAELDRDGVADRLDDRFDRASFFGLPAKAPLRSTRCSRRAPCAIQCCAMAAGSSEKTVASSMAPCLRRTQ